MPTPGDELSRQSQRTIQAAASDARAAKKVAVSAEIGFAKNQSAGWRTLTVIVKDADGRALPLAYVYVVIRSRKNGGSGTLLVDLFAPTPGVEYFEMAPQNIQFDEGYNVAPSVRALMLRTNLDGRAIFNVQASVGDSLLFEAIPFPGASELTTIWLP